VDYCDAKEFLVFMTWVNGAGINFKTSVKKADMEKQIVQINTVPVELYKILKFENIAASGGEAKYLIADGYVKVNGGIETRKRKKIYPGDIIEAMGYLLEIVQLTIHCIEYFWPVQFNQADLVHFLKNNAFIVHLVHLL